MSEENDLLREIRDLLAVIAEPGLEKRDKRLREALLNVVGKSARRAKAVLLMDGTRSQLMIRNETRIDAGDLSRCVKGLRQAGLIGKDDKQPKLTILVQPDFFDSE